MLTFYTILKMQSLKLTLVMTKMHAMSQRDSFVIVGELEKVGPDARVSNEMD